MAPLKALKEFSRIVHLQVFSSHLCAAERPWGPTHSWSWAGEGTEGSREEERIGVGFSGAAETVTVIPFEGDQLVPRPVRQPPFSGQLPLDHRKPSSSHFLHPGP